MVKINFGEVEEFTPLDNGTYRFRVTETEIDQNGENSKHPGNDFWKLTLTVQDGPSEGKSQKMNCMLPPYTPYDLVAILRATVGQHDWSEEDISDGEFDVEIEDLEDLEFLADIKPQKGQDPITGYKNVTRVRPVPEDWDGGGDVDLP